MLKLHVDSVTKTFGARPVLTDVFVSCGKGEIVGLLGKNGSGKSTLLKIIFGSMSAENKFVKIGQKRIETVTEAFGQIKYLPQENLLPKHVRFEEILPLYCTRGNCEILRNMEMLKPLLAKKGGSFSGGEIRLAEILLLIYSDAAFVLLDEPFNGVSPIWKDEIKHHIRLQAEHKGFILTDHDYRNILDISTRLILLRDGGTKPVKDASELEYWNYLPPQSGKNG